MERRRAAYGWLPLVLFVVAASQFVHADSKYNHFDIFTVHPSDDVVSKRSMHARKPYQHPCGKYY